MKLEGGNKTPGGAARLELREEEAAGFLTN